MEEQSEKKSAQCWGRISDNRSSAGGGSGSGSRGRGEEQKEVIKCPAISI